MFLKANCKGSGQLLMILMNFFRWSILSRLSTWSILSFSRSSTIWAPSSQLNQNIFFSLIIFSHFFVSPENSIAVSVIFCKEHFNLHLWEVAPGLWKKSIKRWKVENWWSSPTFSGSGGSLHRWPLRLHLPVSEHSQCQWSCFSCQPVDTGMMNDDTFSF